MAGPATDDRPITRDDLRDGFAALEGEVTDRAEEARTYLLAAAGAAVLAVAAVAFFLGRRRGEQAKTLVEIRRV